MTISVEATYEHGVLKPKQPLALTEGTNVRLDISAVNEKVRNDLETVPEAVRRVRQSAGLIPCTDQAMIEWAAQDPELDYPSREGS